MLIAQMSDIHLKPEGELAYGVADTAKSLARAVSHINELAPRPDLVLITGDLVDEGAEESYVLLRKLLSRLKPPFVIIPGNHDHKATLFRTFPEHKYLGETVEDTGEYICFSIDRYPVRLVGLDTVTPGEHGGGLGPERLAWLDRTLCERPHTPTLVFMHHPPFPSAIGHMDREGFRGHFDLKGMLQSHLQVERLLCGHVHRPVFRRFGGTIATVCPAIGMQVVLDLCPQAPSCFVLEPPSIMLHLWTNLWGEPTLLTHISIVEDHLGQFSGPHPFFGVVSPK